MKQFFLYLLTFAYAGVGVIATVAYWPTIRDLYHHKKPSANTATYFIWTFTSAIAFLYSLFALPDIYFQIVSGLNLLSCSIVYLLILRLRAINNGTKEM